MNSPNPAQRAGWFAQQYEATADLDARYGQRHRPAYAKVGAGYVSACTCSCDRADDALLYPTWDVALDAARSNLAAAEHGESA